MADMRKITVTEGLRELKLYDAKIRKAINNGYFVKAGPKSANNIGGVSKDELVKNIKADYQSVCDLIKNRAILKQKITQSNATTSISVDGMEYTVAEAIERKNSIMYEKMLLEELKTGYLISYDAMTEQNDRVANKIDSMLAAFLGKDSDKKVTAEDLKAISEPYRISNEWELLDPLDICAVIKELEAKIDGFESAVDTQLSISNSTTFIEI